MEGINEIMEEKRREYWWLAPAWAETPARRLSCCAGSWGEAGRAGGEQGIVHSPENLGGAAWRRCRGEVIIHVGALLSFRCREHGCPSVLQDPGPAQVLDEARTREGLSEHLLGADAWGWLWAKDSQSE